MNLVNFGKAILMSIAVFLSLGAGNIFARCIDDGLRPCHTAAKTETSRQIVEKPVINSKSDLRGKLIGKWTAGNFLYLTLNSDGTATGGDKEDSSCKLKFTLTNDILQLKRVVGECGDGDDGFADITAKIRFEKGVLILTPMKNGKIDTEEEEVKWTRVK